jgi:hypothetical protein
MSTKPQWLADVTRFHRASIDWSRSEKLSAADKESVLRRIQGATDYGLLRNCDF